MKQKIIKQVKEKAVEIADNRTEDELIVITVDDQRENEMVDFYKTMVDRYNVPSDTAITVLAKSLAGDKTSYGSHNQRMRQNHV